MAEERREREQAVQAAARGFDPPFCPTVRFLNGNVGE
jgi:hypothetical protein